MGNFCFQTIRSKILFPTEGLQIDYFWQNKFFIQDYCPGKVIAFLYPHDIMALSLIKLFDLIYCYLLITNRHISRAI